MTTWFVSRHPGAVQWLQRQGIQVDRLTAHLRLEEVRGGDVIIGTLPAQMIFAANLAGARYLHLSVDLPPEDRGRELTADDLDRCHARLQALRVVEDPAA